MPLPEIKFGTDGWRGVVADDFTYASVRRVAQGIAEYMRSRTKDPLAVVGYDCRFASEEFARTVADVFGANGVRSLIFDRPSPTQVASWTVIHRKATGAAVITASHNPWLFNGVKYKPETGSSADSTVIGELEKRINALGEIERPDREKVSQLVSVYDPRDAYYEQIGRMVDLPRLREAGLRVVHECMHGSGYGYVAELLGGGRTTVTQLHADRNPFFGGLNPEPIPPNIDEAVAVMKGGGHDLCILTDGDADRVGIIDETGRFINQLQVFALLVLHLFDVLDMRGPIVKTVNMTSMVEQLAKQFNTEVYEVQVGFKYVAPKMMETNAVIGGEESGGFGVRGHIPERDGILIGMLFADMIVRRGKPLSEILRDLEQRVGPHAYARHDIHLHRETYDQDRKRITEQLANHQPKEIAGVKVARVRSDDGFKFYLEDGSWVLFRTSGTEPLVRIYSEAPDAAAVEARLKAIEQIVGLKQEAPFMPDMPAVYRAEETLVEKPWGYEIRWAITDRYLGKILHVRKGEALSLQYHERKDEWLLVTRGTVDMELGVENGELKKHRMREGDSVHLAPLTRHRITAVEDADIYEVSTPEIEDVVRLEDRYGRA